MSSRPLTIVVAPFNAVGHVNACAGATSALLARGHRVVFVVDESFRGQLSARGFEEFVYDRLFHKPGDVYAELLLRHRLIGEPRSVLDRIDHFGRFLETADFLDELVYFNEGVQRAIDRFEPDLLWYDGNEGVPAVVNSGLPWVHNLSFAPTFYEFHEQLPPGGSGFATDASADDDNDGTDNKTAWAEVNEARRRLMYSRVYNDLWQQLGYDRYEHDVKLPDQYVLTVYACPAELNHAVIAHKPGWFNLEVFNRPTVTDVRPLSETVPQAFLDDDLDGRFSGRYVYVSMGSMGSIDLRLMRRIVAPLASLPHKFIVSKGPRHVEYDLPANMWGDRFLPQAAVLPHVQLVITHGGNNTVTETFAAGKPMLVLPQFLDQFDNAQRLAETGFGTRLDTYHFTEEELVEAVETMLADDQLRTRLECAAERIRAHDRHTELAIKIERLVEDDGEEEEKEEDKEEDGGGGGGAADLREGKLLDKPKEVKE